MRFALTKLPPTRQLEGCSSRRAVTKATREEQQLRLGDLHVQAELPPTPTAPMGMQAQRHTATIAAVTTVEFTAGSEVAETAVVAVVVEVVVEGVVEGVVIAVEVTAEAAETVEASAVAAEMVVEGVVMAAEAVAMAAEAARGDAANSRPMTPTIRGENRAGHTAAAHSRISQSWCTRNTLKLNKRCSN